MALDSDATSISPAGLALVLLVVTLFFVPPCALVVLLRCWVKVKQGHFGMDDGLMLLGWILFMCVVGIVSRGTYTGLGTTDAYLNDNLQESGRRSLWLFQTFYCCSLLFIKGSICVTLLRIAVQRSHRIIVWVTLTIACISTLIVIIGLMAMCRPITANWDPSAGTCSSSVVITSLSYLVSAAAVLTDWICAILPGVMLYKTQMKPATKVSISIILGLGVLASVATIVRLPYISFYAKHDNYLHNVANITLWSIFETGTGIIAGSLPAMRLLLKRWVNFDSAADQTATAGAPFTGTNKGTVTSRIGASGRGHMGLRSAATGHRDWEPLDDAASSHKIYVKVDVEMQSLETSGRSAGSTDEMRMHA